MVLWLVVVFYSVFNEHYGAMEYVAFALLLVATVMLCTELVRAFLLRRQWRLQTRSGED
ncbi:hypothetical protein GCM10020367_05310 [Streptomyces sannanensis]|uniref:Uncharacterized protein n=1 Tax=Streptomyces sannanensis TaxID=285536 RepID=A0ABP6S4X4_9ACTN